MSTNIQETTAWRGRTAVDVDGDKIGTIEEIYLDTDSGEPEWLAVRTGLFGTHVSFVPLAQAREDGDDIRVPFPKGHVKGAPNVDPDGQLSQREEAALYRHYELDYASSDGDRSGREPVGRDVSGPTTDDAMTRSEEELRVGTREREAGRARLRKYVVTDEVTQTVPVRREEVRVEREPITDANVDDALDGPAISEEEHEVVLHAEEPVVEKRAVPKERVRLDKDVEVEQREVRDEVRREEIDVDAPRGTR
jgi:uncharacterized protein (TIGR02271 family)